MGYRGEDRSSERAAWGAQSPRQSSRQHTDYDSPGYDGTGYDSPGYDNAGYDGFGQGDSDGPGEYGADGYDSGGYRSGGYRADDYDSGAHRTADQGGTGAYSTGGYDSGGYSGSGSYADDYSSGSHAAQGYHSAPYSSDTSYGSDTPYESDTSYGSSHRSGGYPTLGQGSGGYPTQAHGSGGYPTLGHGSGGYPPQAHGSGGYPTLGHGSGGYPALDPDSYDDGNDWYARSGPIPAGGFADTSAQLAIRDTPSRDLVPRDVVSRDPVRGYPPEPAHPDPGLAATRQQVRYDESAYVSYPGYDGVENDAQGYDSRRGYDYDDYADATRLDQVAIDYDSPRGAPDGRGYGQALQGDGFDGGFRDDPGQPDDILAGPGKRPKKSRKPNADQPRRRSGRALVLSAVVVVLVAAAGYGGYQVLLKSKANNSAVDQQVSQPLPTGSAASAAPKCAPQLGPYCHIELRTDDPVPVTIGELYPPQIFSTAAKIGFELEATRTDKNCSSAVYGTDLAAQLKKGECTQALRASYVSQDGTIIGTIGVFNLSSTNQAHYAAKIINGSNFVMPLSSAHGVIAKLGQGTGVIEPEFKGHYLILTYAEFATLKAPSTQAQTKQLEDWENALVASTANVYLSQLMVNGDSPAASASASASATTSASATPTATATH